MADDLIEKARAKIVFHEEQIRRLREFISTGEALAADEVRPIPEARPNFFVENPNMNRLLGGAPPTTPTSVVLEEAAAVLRELDRPTPAAEIYERLVRRGVTIAGRSPKGNMTAKFATRKDVFSFHKESQTWSLVELLRRGSRSPNENGEAAASPDAGQGSRPDQTPNPAPDGA